MIYGQDTAHTGDGRRMARMIDGDLGRWIERPLSRRQVLRGAGRGALGAGTLAALLAACGPDEPVAPRTTLPPKAGELSVAQWPLYIDRARGGHRPTLEAFEEEYDVAVKYREVIADNQQFFATLVPFFDQGRDTGWDLVALSDWVVGLMRDAGWLETVHLDRLPNVEQNLLPAFRNPLYDPQNAHSVPWQGRHGHRVRPQPDGVRDPELRRPVGRAPRRTRRDAHGDGGHDEPHTAHAGDRAEGRHARRRRPGPGTPD